MRASGPHFKLWKIRQPGGLKPPGNDVQKISNRPTGGTNSGDVGPIKWLQPLLFRFPNVSPKSLPSGSRPPGSPFNVVKYRIYFKSTIVHFKRSSLEIYIF